MYKLYNAKYSGAFRNPSKIYDGAFLRKDGVFCPSLFSQKSSIVDVRLGSKYASEII